MSMLWFYCDESYDSQNNPPNVYVVAGFAAEIGVWEKIERAWTAKNKRVRVPWFHASHLNAGAHEYAGWTKKRRQRYSSDLLKILARHKHNLHAVSVGVLASEYERVLDEPTRKRLGHPHILCFKQCVALLAEELHYAPNRWPKDVKFSVLLEQNRYDIESVAAFEQMKRSPWRAAYRLGTCMIGARDEFIPLQVADLIAYETFKYVHNQKFRAGGLRVVLEKLFPVAGFTGFYYDDQMLKRTKELTEASPQSTLIITLPPHIEKPTHDEK